MFEFITLFEFIDFLSFRFLCEETIEERIVQLQEKKKALADTVLYGFVHEVFENINLNLYQIIYCNKYYNILYTGTLY